MGQARLLIATEIGSPGDGLAAAAALAVAIATAEQASGGGAGVLLVEAGGATRRRPTLLSSAPARALEASLAEIAGARPAARGRVCWTGLDLADGWRRRLRDLAGRAGGAVVAHLPAAAWREALDDPDLAPSGALVRADVRVHRHLLALLAAELRGRGLALRVATRPLGLVGSRRVLAGLDPGGPAARRAVRAARALAPGGEGPGLIARVRGGAAAGQAGQALPLVAGLCFVVLALASVTAALGGAVTATAAKQRAADLAALSAARSMRDDANRLIAPPRLADGSPNPAHLPRARFLGRARAAAVEAARRNGIDARRVAVRFPDAGAPVPLRARVGLEGDPGRWAEAQAAPPASAAAPLTTAAGGGYSGPLEHRQGKPMRPDVAEAFDRLAAAAGRAGHSLVVTSAYRSDAEQARLFAANPDPRWVAPPGRSLHRCGTELDLGPASAHGWLAANAPRFGFVKRYSWEPWHFGYTRGPAPCAAGAALGARGGDGAEPAAVPAFVPSRYRAPIIAAASRHGVSATLLAAQLMAESGFDPGAVSPAGARGIAQFMPATAAAYGLRDPFDPGAAIDAQARLMSDLLRQFGSVPLALAAYNAGPGPVAACGCVPSYAETQAYVARIMALTGGAGDAVPPLEVRLVA